MDKVFERYYIMLVITFCLFTIFQMYAFGEMILYSIILLMVLQFDIKKSLTL